MGHAASANQLYVVETDERERMGEHPYKTMYETNHWKNVRIQCEFVDLTDQNPAYVDDLRLVHAVGVR